MRPVELVPGRVGRTIMLRWLGKASKRPLGFEGPLGTRVFLALNKARWSHAQARRVFSGFFKSSSPKEGDRSCPRDGAHATNCAAAL
jgi:hypothetical protein